MPDGCYADGTWELKMHVTDLKRDVSLRVTGEIHIGGVMLKLVEKLGKLRVFLKCLFNRMNQTVNGHSLRLWVFVAVRVWSYHYILCAQLYLVFYFNL